MKNLQSIMIAFSGGMKNTLILKKLSEPEEEIAAQQSYLLLGKKEMLYFLLATEKLDRLLIMSQGGLKKKLFRRYKKPPGHSKIQIKGGDPEKILCVSVLFTRLMVTPPTNIIGSLRRFTEQYNIIDRIPRECLSHLTDL